MVVYFDTITCIPIPACYRPTVARGERCGHENRESERLTASRSDCRRLSVSWPLIQKTYHSTPPKPITQSSPKDGELVHVC